MEPGYLEYGKGMFANYFQFLTDYAKFHSDLTYNHDKANIYRNMQTINRCFYPNTIEEIMENLRLENTPFSLQCLEKMQTNSMLSMKIALKMLRESKSLDFKGCLLNEINVSLNKIQDSEFDLGISEVLLKPGMPT